MLIVGALVGLAVAAAIAAPRILTIGTWQVHYPRLALTLWFGAFGLGLSALAASVVAAVTVTVLSTPTMSEWEAVVITAVAWLSLGAVGGVVSMVAVSAGPLAESSRRAVDHVAPVAVAREPMAGVTLVWFDSDRPQAFALNSSGPEIFLSTSLRAHLTEPQLLAVIDHERAHLRHRHGLALRIAELNAVCLPAALTSGRALRRATLLLVELIADDAAARRRGPAHLANALAALARATNDESMELRAERLTLHTWKRRSLRTESSSEFPAIST